VEGWAGEGEEEVGAGGVGGSTKRDLGLEIEERRRRSAAEAGGRGGREGLDVWGGFSGLGRGGRLEVGVGGGGFSGFSGVLGASAVGLWCCWGWGWSGGMRRTTSPLATAAGFALVLGRSIGRARRWTQRRVDELGLGL
jgi:hypothetical protein